MTLACLNRIPALALILTLGGCAAAFGTTGATRTTSSSMVDFLYPEGERPVVDTDITPRLELPLRVGIAFVPTMGEMRWQRDIKMAEARRLELLQNVKAAFEQVDYIEAIEIIPSTYLSRVGGFEALEQTSRLYDLDVFALVSWDQVVNTEETPFSLLYWTLVGGYVIPATQNSVHTMLDTAVLDVRTRKLLLRAPGFHHSSAQTTAVAADSGRRKISDSSFAGAIETMTRNLDAEIEAFGKRVKEDKSVEIAYSKNYRGASATFALLGVLGLAVLLMARTPRRRT